MFQAFFSSGSAGSARTPARTGAVVTDGDSDNDAPRDARVRGSSGVVNKKRALGAEAGAGAAATKRARTGAGGGAPVQVCL